jgi:hypothetical protein
MLGPARSATIPAMSISVSRSIPSNPQTIGRLVTTLGTVFANRLAEFPVCPTGPAAEEAINFQLNACFSPSRSLSHHNLCLRFPDLRPSLRCTLP